MTLLRNWAHVSGLSLSVSLSVSLSFSLTLRHTLGTVERERKIAKKTGGQRWMRRAGGRDRSGGTRLRERNRENEGKRGEVRGKGYEAEFLSFYRWHLLKMPCKYQSSKWFITPWKRMTKNMYVGNCDPLNHFYSPLIWGRSCIRVALGVVS